MIRVVLGDDSFLAREGIARVLDAIDDVDLVAACGDLEELRSAVDKVRPDVVVTDIRMPPTNTDEGIRFASELRTSHPKVGVVVLSQHAEPAYAMSLFEDGSSQRAYLLKERVKDEDELARALREVVAGRSLVDPRIVDKLVSARLNNDPGIEKLTPREREILSMIAEGRSNTAIAGDPRDHETRRRASHQRDLPQARPGRGFRCEPARQGGTALLDRQRTLEAECPRRSSRARPRTGIGLPGSRTPRSATPWA